jgi:hypothetical protein
MAGEVQAKVWYFIFYYLHSNTLFEPNVVVRNIVGGKVKPFKPPTIHILWSGVWLRAVWMVVVR